MGNGNDFGDLRLHRFCIAEGESEQTFKEVVLMQVVIALVSDLEEIPNLFQGFGVENVVAGGMTEGEEELNLSLLVTSAPVLVGIRVSGGVGQRRSAVNHIPESSVFEDQSNHLAPVSIVIPIVIEEWNLILAMLELWLSGRRGGGGTSLGSGSGVVLCGGVVGLCAEAGWHIGGVSMTTAGSASTMSGHRHGGVSRGNEALRVERAGGEWSRLSS